MFSVWYKCGAAVASRGGDDAKSNYCVIWLGQSLSPCPSTRRPSFGTARDGQVTRWSQRHRQSAPGRPGVAASAAPMALHALKWLNLFAVCKCLKLLGHAMVVFVLTLVGFTYYAVVG